MKNEFMKHDESVSVSMRRIMLLASIEAHKRNSLVGPLHVLIGMMLEGENSGCDLLSTLGVTIEKLREISRSARLSQFSNLVDVSVPEKEE